MWSLLLPEGPRDSEAIQASGARCAMVEMAGVFRDQDAALPQLAVSALHLRLAEHATEHLQRVLRQLALQGPCLRVATCIILLTADSEDSRQFLNCMIFFLRFESPGMSSECWFHAVSDTNPEPTRYLSVLSL